MENSQEEIDLTDDENKFHIDYESIGNTEGP